MSQKRVTLHLSKTNATVFLSTLHRLMGQYVIRARCSGLAFVRNHVSESLIVAHADVNIALHLVSEDA